MATATGSARPAAQAELDAWADHLRAEGKRPKTVASYRKIVSKLLDAYPEKRFTDFRQEDILRFVEPLEEQYRAQYASMIRMWFKWGELTEQIIDVDNPTRLLPKYKWKRTGSSRDELFSDEEIARLQGLPHPDGVLMEILFRTGVKKGETRTLTGRQCELDVPQLRIIDSAAPRVIPITDGPFRDRLARMLQVEKIGPDDWLWYSHPGGSRERRHNREVSDGAMHLWWARCLSAARVRHRGVRIARRTYARNMVNAGVRLDDLNLILGHNDYYTTNEYYADDRYPDALRRVLSMNEATAVIRHQRDLLQRVLPHLLTPGAPGALELAKEISAVLTEPV